MLYLAIYAFDSFVKPVALSWGALAIINIVHDIAMTAFILLAISLSS